MFSSYQRSGVVYTTLPIVSDWEEKRGEREKKEMGRGRRIRTGVWRAEVERRECVSGVGEAIQEERLIQCHWWRANHCPVTISRRSLLTPPSMNCHILFTVAI